MHKALFLALTICCVSILYAQPSNDECSGATTINSSQLDDGNANCVNLTNQTTVNATEWTIPPGVTFTGNCWGGISDLNVVFYSFDAQGASGSVEVLNGPDDYFVSVIEFNGVGCDGTDYTEWGCGDNAPITFTNQLVPGNTYYVIVAFENNTEGTFDLCVSNPPAAPNDLCVNAIDLPSLDGMSCNSGLNNYYPSSETTTPSCFPADAAPSVWYSFTAQGVSIANLHIENAPDNAHIALWDFNGGTNCDLSTGTVLDCEANVTSVNPLTADNVLVPGNTYYLQVGFSNSATGDFEICLDAPVPAFNDDCMQAAVYPSSELSDPNNCLTQIGGQQLNSDWPSNDIVVPSCWDGNHPENLWFQFTAQGPDATIDVQPSFGANAQVAIVSFAAGNNCIQGSASVLACSDNGQLDFQNGLTPGENYYLLVGFDSDQTGDYCVNIYNPVPPPNDVPCNAVSISGGCVPGTTENANPEFPPTSFPPECAPNLENTAWFTAQLSDPNSVGLEIDISEISGQDFSIVIGTFNDCSGTFFTEAIECGQNFPYEFGPVSDPNQVYYIMVGSSNANAGDFEICVNDVQACFDNNDCPNVEVIGGVVTNSGFTCVDGCNLWASPYAGATDCNINSNPVVWYGFQSDAAAITLNVNLESSDISSPTIMVFAGTCGSLHNILSSNGDPCVNGSAGSVTGSFPIDPGMTYYIAVSGFNTAGGDFQLCVSTLGEQTPCVLEHSQRVTYRSNGGSLDGPFLPDEQVTVCYTIDQFMPPPNQCQWLQGVVPSLGNGWRVVPFTLAGATLNGNNFPTPGVHGGEWAYYTDVTYNHTVPYLSVGDFDGNMTPDMCNSNYDPNCNGPGVTGGINNGVCFQGGTILPPGWFCANRVDPCADIGHPNVDWGDGEGCFGVHGPWEFCVDLQVMGYPECQTFNDLTLSFFPLTDSEVGSRVGQNPTSSVCANDQPSTVEYKLCCVEDESLQENFPPFCTPGTFAYTPDHPGVDFWEWIVNPPPNVVGASPGSGPDGTTVINTLTNNGTTTEIVEYIFQGFAGGDCPAVLKTVYVQVVPELIVELSSFNACATPITPYELTPSVTGGLGMDYNFEWFDGSTDQTLLISDPIPGQLYAVTVSDETGCTREASVTLNVYETFPVDIDAALQEQCFSDGPIDLNADASQGTPGYSYEWTSPMGNNVTGPSIPALETGQWNVLVTDSQGCIGEDSVSLNFFESPNLTILPDIAEICPLNPEPEQITATAQGGLPPYFFEWQTPGGISTSSFIFAEEVGQYIVEVTDFNGCTTEVTVDVGEAPHPTFDLGGDVEICRDDLIVGYNINVPDDPNYIQYEWSTGETSQSINVTQEGLYTVTVTNLQGCIGIEEIDLSTYEPIGDVFPFDTATFCEGGFAEIEGPFDYSYEWSTGATGNPLIVVSDQNIVVTVTDQNGCTTEDVIEVIESTSLLPNIQGDSVICNNSAVELISANFAIIEWYDSPALATPIQIGENTLLVSEPGWYFVQVSDGNGCFGLDSVLVSEGDPQVSIAGDNAICDGDIAALDAGTWDQIQWSTGEATSQITTDTPGLFSVTVTDAFGCTAISSLQVDESDSPEPDITGSQTFCTGGSTNLDAGGPFDSYEWSTGGSTQQISVSTAGTVYVTVTNAEGCEGIDSISVTESIELMPGITGDSTVCNGVAVVIDAGAGYTSYSWSGGGNAQTLSVSTPGTYTVTVTDASGCTGTDAIDVTESTAQVNITGDNVLCEGESTMLTATAGFDDYEWSTTETTEGITVSTNGSFTVTVTDDQGCTGTATFDVTVSPLPTVNITGSTTFCTGGETTLNAGSGFSDYNWSTGESAQTISTNTPGNVGVTVTDVNGCTATDEVSISESNELSPEITGDSVICDNAQTDLDAGPGYATYEWSTGGNNQVITTANAGTYTVTVTDNSGCTGSDSFTVSTGSAIVAITGDDQFCEGESTTLAATTGYTDYAWSTGDLTETIDVSASGSYTVTVTDQVGCTGTGEITVTVEPEPMPSIAGSLSFCTGGSTLLDAGMGFVDYQWSTGSSDQTVSISQAGAVSVTVTDANGCTGTASANVIEADELILNVSDTSVCLGETVTLIVGSFDTYEWSTTETTPTIDVTNSGSYSVTVSDLTGCTGSATISVTEVIPPSAFLVDSSVCNASAGGSRLDLNDLIISGDMSGNWTDLDNSGASGPVPMLDFDGVSPGIYRFEYTTGSAQPPCVEQVYIVRVEVLDCACPSLALDDPPDLCNDNATLDLEDLFIAGITETGGTWTIVDDPGGSDPATLSGSLFNATDADAGSYRIQYELSGVPSGCPNSETVDLRVVESAFAGFSNDPVQVCVGDDSTIVLRQLLESEDGGGTWIETSVVSSVAGFNAAAGTFNTSVEVAGTYLFDYIVSAQAPCTDAVTTVEIVIEDVPIADAGPDRSITCDEPSVTVGGAASSQGADFTYRWTTTNGMIADPDELFTTIRDSGTYLLAVENTVTGCISYDEVLVNVIGDIPTGLDYDLMVPECEGDPAAALQIIGVTGGTEPYVYSLNGADPVSDLFFDDLQPGIYALSVQDDAGCRYETVFTVPQPNYLEAQLAGDLSIQRGETALITYALSSGIVASADWTDDSGNVLCAGCDTFSIQPIGNLSFDLTLTDSNGCVIVLPGVLTVSVNRDIYVPNVFSPNGDGVNDHLTVYGEPELTIEVMRVFSRWGELLFESTEIPANTPEEGWDGTMGGNELMPGVYVLTASVRYLDGVNETVIRDVTLVK